MDYAAKLQRVQSWLGTKTLDIYSGVYTASWRAPQFEQNLAIPYQREHVDTAIVKCGERGIEWYDGTFPAIRQVFLNHGVGCAPYTFPYPWSVQADIDLAAKLANEAGGVILDCEETFRNQSGALKALVNGVRAKAPDKVIIVSGYGDPTYAFGYSWDFSSIAEADAYQPQWYLGWWSPYHQHGWEYALNWADQQCADAFNHFGLGAGFPIQPAINVEGMNQNDLQPLAKHLAAWKEGIAVWEARDVTAPMIGYLEAGLHAA